MKTILVVDDSATLRLAIRRLLEPMGYAVEEAENGEAALRFCLEERPVDAILLDIDMPVLDGISFLTRLRLDPTLRQPPVVMCTTHSSLAQISEALSAGADEYIMKPFDAEILGSKLAEIGVA